MKGLKTAEAAFSNLCDGGDTRSCLYLVSMVEEGMPEQPDAPRAAEMYQKLCDKKVGEACFQLAELVSSQKLGATELRAIDFYKAACNAKFARGCSSAASRLTTGIGARKDPKEAATYFWAACQLNEQEETEACQRYKPATPRR
jgi:TPR repeat protein